MLVFFSHPSSYYARLRTVERDGNQFTVSYQFEPHLTPESTVHFALIPLGKLPAGEYRVVYRQLPIDEKFAAQGFQPVEPRAAELVAHNFKFTIGEVRPDETFER
jgi:hypothetical protein